MMPRPPTSPLFPYTTLFRSVVGGEAIDQDEGPYGAEGFVRQAVATLPHYDGNYAALGSWIAAGQPCGLSVREDVSPIDRKSTRLNSSHVAISYAVFCLKKKK